MCGGHDRFRFDDKNGEGMFYCNACGAGDGMTLLMGVTGMSFKEAADAVDEVVGNVPNAPPQAPKRDPRLRLRKMATSLHPPAGPVSKYLASRYVTPAMATKYAEEVPYYEDGVYAQNYPAMVHLLSGPAGDPLTYHITYLTPEGLKAPVKAPRKILPPVGEMKGGAIRLMPCTDTLAIAEGIETALAVHKMYGMPTWASYSANLLEQFQPPESVKKILVFSDNDFSYTGQRSAYILAHRLNREGLQVTVRMPDIMGTDFADEIKPTRRNQ